MSKSRNKIKALSCCLLLVLLTTGCWGRRETDELGYILATGIDKGKENLIKVTFQVAVPSALAGGSGGGGGEKATENISVEAASLFGALQLANSFVSRDLTFIHNELVVVSEEIAREGLDKYINPLVRSREIRRNITITVSRGSASEFLNSNEPVLEKNTARQFELLLGAKGYTGFILDTTLNEFNKRSKSPGSSPILTLVGVNKGKKDKPEERGNFAEKVRTEVAYFPGEVPREGGNKIEIIGVAVFKKDRLVGFLNGSETRYYLMMTDNFNSAILTIPEPNKEEKIIAVRVTRGRNPERNVDLTGDKPKITIRIILEGEILSVQSGINYEGGQKEKELEQYIETYINREASEVIKKTQAEFKSDILELGEETRKYFWTWQDWINYGWLERYSEAEVIVDTNLEIRRYGLMRQTAPIPEEGSE